VPKRFNLAPTDNIPAIREPHKLELLRWGLEMPEKRQAGINVRIESLGWKHYRDNLRDRRCVIVVSAFYEWLAQPTGKKIPHLIYREDGHPLIMAGIFDHTSAVAMVTKPSHGIVSSLHDRMPAVLSREMMDAWLGKSADVLGILEAANANGLTAHPVSDRVNSVRKDDPMLIERVPEHVVEEPKGKTLRLFP
jgi:putative SOS response-associated peptidase YedK